MLKLTATACIDAPVQAVWAVLSDLDAIHLWVKAIQHSYCPTQDRAHGEQTLVTTTAEATMKGGPVGILLELLAKPLFERLGAQSLASLKYYVEHGSPFPGRARDLALAPAGC